MKETLEIGKCNTRGYTVDIPRWNEGGSYDVEEYAFEHPLGALAVVLRWLGYGEDVEHIIEELDDSAIYVLTEKGKKAADEIARLKRVKTSAVNLPELPRLGLGR